tara:strand:- start:68 stop:634 length:567 start_codon:yes stop_codon:yes gene_type:complete
MPTNYGVQGPDLGRFGAAPNLDSPVLGGEPTGSLGGAGAGLIESQEQARQFREQRERAMQQNRMAQELRKILASIQPTSQNTGLSAGMGTPAPFMGIGPDATGDIGGVNRSRAQQFFGGTLNNPANFAAQGPLGSQAFGSQLDNMLGGLGQGPSGIGLGPGMGAGMGAGIGAGMGAGLGGFDVGGMFG